MKYTYAPIITWMEDMDHFHLCQQVVSLIMSIDSVSKEVGGGGGILMTVPGA